MNRRAWLLLVLLAEGVEKVHRWTVKAGSYYSRRQLFNGRTGEPVRWESLSGGDRILAIDRREGGGIENIEVWEVESRPDVRFARVKLVEEPRLLVDGGVVL